jgi:bacterioferritin-associated ferredoxin
LEAQVIVCSCNLLTDSDIRASLAKPNAPERVRDVYASLGCAPQCGGCARSINRLIDEAKAESNGSAFDVEQRDAA